MKIFLLFLATYFFITEDGVNARELEDTAGLLPSLYTQSQSETAIDKKVKGEIDSFTKDSSQGDKSCSSCGS